MAKTSKNKIPLRNPTAHVARMRRAPTMDHRNEPRGGSRNTQADLAEEIDTDPVTDTYLDYDSVYSED